MSLYVETSSPRLRVGLTCPDGVTAVVGPNGAGKTTLLHTVAGLAPGTVRLGHEDWTARSPADRRVGLVHQDHQLFPHLTALENVAFGPRARGARRSDARRLAQDWLDRLGVGHLAARRPGELSGGQAQRVAITRALATQPDVLLLDEPFAALDVAVAQELRELLAAHLEEYDGPVLLVTHDPLDVHALADRVVVLEHGRLVQDGTPAEVMDAPATSHAAQLLGVNVVRGTALEGGLVDTAAGLLVTATPARGPVVVSFRPSAVTLTADEPHGSARNAWRGLVVGLSRMDATVRLHVRTTGGLDLRVDVTPAAVEQLGLAVGGQVWASVKATELSVFGAARPGEPEEALSVDSAT